MEEKKSEEDASFCKQRKLSAKDQLAQAIGSIEVNGLREDMVREALRKLPLLQLKILYCKFVSSIGFGSINC